MDSHFSLEGEEFKNSGTFFLLSMKSAFSHLKVIELLGVPQSKNASKDILICNVDEVIEDNNVTCKSKSSISILDMAETAAMDLYSGQSGCYSCNLAIDPFWPLCMYELRGKCNNDECSWQHVKDYCCDSMKHDSIDNSGNVTLM